MAMTPEGKVRKKVIELLKELNIFYFMPVNNGMGVMGVSDIICCSHGFFIAIECKAGKGKTTALQDRFLASVEDHGGFGFVVNENNIDALKERLIWLLAKKN